MAERLEIEITADTSNAQRNIGGLTSALGGLGSIAAGVVTAGLGIALAGITALGAGLALSINEAMDAQVVLAQTNAVIESTGGIAGITAQAAQDLAGSLAEVTRFSDDAILAGENILLTFTNIGQEVFPQATQTILDMSTALGQDLQSSAIQLGKALQDPIEGVSALSRVGVNFTDVQKEMIKSLVESGNVLEAQNMILRELQVEFGGSAVAAGQTFAGSLDILKNSALDLAETIGTGLLGSFGEEFSGTFEGAKNIINALSGAFDQFFGNVEAGMSPVQAFRFAFEELIPPTFRPLFNEVMDLFRNFELLLRRPDVQESLQELGQALSTTFNQGLPIVLDGIADSFTALSNLISRHGPAIITILETITGLVEAVNNSPGFWGAFAGAGLDAFQGAPGQPANSRSSGNARGNDQRDQSTNLNNFGPVSVFPQTPAQSMGELLEAFKGMT